MKDIQSGRPLIDTPAEAVFLREEAASWLDTPFSPRQCVKGAAVDCVQFPVALLNACGAGFPSEFPGYTVDRSKHCADSLILQWIKSLGALAKPIPVDEAWIGDVCVFTLNLCVDHCGILMDDDRFFHAVWPVGVTTGHLCDPTWGDTLHSIWRPYKRADSPPMTIDS